MKYSIRILFLFFANLLLSCSPGANPSIPPIGGDITDPDELHIKPFTSGEMSLILADTITPPSNPMAPGDLSSYPTFEGRLGLNYVSVLPVAPTGYYCCIYLDTPLQIEFGGGPLTIDNIVLMDKNRQFVRFDHPALESYHVGDRILLTGTPYNISYTCVGVTMYFIQPAQ